MINAYRTPENPAVLASTPISTLISVLEVLAGILQIKASRLRAEAEKEKPAEPKAAESALGKREFLASCVIGNMCYMSEGKLTTGTPKQIVDAAFQVADEMLSRESVADFGAWRRAARRDDD